MRGKGYKKILAVIAAVTVTLSMGVSYKANALEVSNQNVLEVSNEENIPSKYQAKYTEVKNQEINGVCWSFAGMATIESYLLNQGIGTYDFSEEYIKWMADEGNNSDCGWLINRGSGAPTQVVPGLIVSGKGPVSEDKVAYDSNNKSEMPSDLLTLKPEIDVSEIEYIENDSSKVKKAVMNYGAVETCYYHDGQYAVNNSTSYYCDKKASTNHAVTIIGWDDTFSKDNFNEGLKPQNDGAWLIKNSSGKNVGQDGLEWVSYEDKNILTTDNGNVNYAIRKAQKHNDNRKIYQYDKYGTVADCSIASSNDYKTLTYANVYDFSGDDEVLNSVIFQNNNIGNNYTVFYMPVSSNGDILQDKKIKLAEGVTSFKGYVEIPVNNYKLQSGKGAIAIEVSGQDSNIGIGVESQVNLEGENAFKADYNEGESYVILGEHSYDINKDVNPIQKGNLSIKAVTLKNTDTSSSDNTGSGNEGQNTGTATQTPEQGSTETPGTSTQTPGQGGSEGQDSGTGTQTTNQNPATGTQTTNQDGSEQKPADTSGSTNSGDIASIPIIGLIVGTFGAFVTSLVKGKSKQK